MNRLALLAAGALCSVLAGCGGVSEAASPSPSATPGIGRDAIVTAACAGSVESDDGNYVRCGGSGLVTFIRFFETPGALQVWSSRFSCGSGFAVGGSNWIAYQIGAQDRAVALVDLGGKQVC